MKDLAIALENRPGALAEMGVNIDALYSDHDHRLILVVTDMIKVQGVANS